MPAVDRVAIALELRGIYAQAYFGPAKGGVCTFEQSML
jgi:hypothetical protein